VKNVLHVEKYTGRDRLNLRLWVSQSEEGENKASRVKRAFFEMVE
jgi:hypothetical protein